MSRKEHGRNGEGEPPKGDAYGLVCALCERKLEGRFETRAEADLSADEHAVDEHPDRDEVVIWKAPVESLVTGEERGRSEAGR